MRPALLAGSGRLTPVSSKTSQPAWACGEPKEAQMGHWVGPKRTNDFRTISIACLVIGTLALVALLTFYFYKVAR